MSFRVRDFARTALERSTTLPLLWERTLCATAFRSGPHGCCFLWGDFAFGCHAAASLPPTRRAFRSPAGARVTFLLLAQKKS